MKAFLKKVVAGETLTEEESHEMIRQIMAEETPGFCASALLTALSMREETAAELTGCARYLRENAIRIPVTSPCADIVGTGGDGARTFNISTTAAFVAAGAGVRVAKHGNRAVSSSCGAADVLEALGIPINKHPEELATSLAEHGFAFLFARNLHPAMAKVAPLRQSLGIRTIFNLVGPLANPAGAEYMVVGTCSNVLLRPFAEVLHRLGVKRAMIVHSSDGMDEISSQADTNALLLNQGNQTNFTIKPGEYLRPEECAESLLGGDAQENKQILLSILSGEDHTAKRGAVLLNAAALCMVFGLAKTMQEGVSLARKSLDDHSALNKLHEMQR